VCRRAVERNIESRLSPLDATPPPFRRRVTNAQEAREAVRDLKRRGVDLIKVHNNTLRDVFFAIAKEAGEL
jgi:hypothetical protein